MICSIGIGGGPGCGTEGMRFTSNFGGAAIGPWSCARAQRAPRHTSAIRQQAYLLPRMALLLRHEISWQVRCTGEPFALNAHTRIVNPENSTISNSSQLRVLLRPGAALIRSCVCEPRVARAVAEEQSSQTLLRQRNSAGRGVPLFRPAPAERLGLAGYARNLRDGRVEVYAVGPAHSLDALRAELERGPRSRAFRECAKNRPRSIRASPTHFPSSTTNNHKGDEWTI